MAPDSVELVARIYNAAYMVRYHARGGRMANKDSPAARKRQEAIRNLGLAVRLAFNATENFEPLLIAVFDGLSARDAPPF